MRTALVSIVAAAALAFVGCGGRSAACTKAVNCGTAVTAVGGTAAEASVKQCEGAGAATDTCCGLLTAGYTIQAGATPPAACN